MQIHELLMNSEMANFMIMIKYTHSISFINKTNPHLNIYTKYLLILFYIFRYVAVYGGDII